MAFSKKTKTAAHNQAATEERFPASVVLDPGAIKGYAPVSRRAIVHMYNVALPTLEALANQEAAAALQALPNVVATDFDRKADDANANAATAEGTSAHERAARELLREAFEDV